MEVWDVRQDDEISKTDDPHCSECGEPLVHPEDIKEGIHFLCDPTVVVLEDEDDDDFESGC